MAHPTIKQQDKLPFPFNAANALGELLNRAGFVFPRLTVDSVQQHAINATGLSDFGDPWYMEGLEQLIRSVNEDGLNFLGRFETHLVLRECAANRLQWVEMQRTNPEAFQVPLKPPLVIIGMYRTGTTLLHRMLASDPANQGLPMWQLAKPFPPARGKKDNRRKFLDQQIRLFKMMRPALAHKHHVSADTPEECAVCQGMTFTSHFFYDNVPVQSYLKWYENTDRSKLYQEYASLLHWYQAADPRRLILKSPSHTGDECEFLAAVPNAMLVHTHRDPVEAVNSTNSLFHTDQSIYMAPYRPEKLGETNLNMLGKMIDRNMANRESGGVQIFDVDYKELVRDPIYVARNIYDHYNIEWTRTGEQAMRNYLNSQPEKSHRKHQYSSEEYGLTDDQINSRFSEYRKRFLQPESERTDQ